MVGMRQGALANVAQLVGVLSCITKVCEFDFLPPSFSSFFSLPPFPLSLSLSVSLKKKNQ